MASSTTLRDIDNKCSTQIWTLWVLLLCARHLEPPPIIFTFAQIALGVIIAWGRTIYSEFELLAGKSAPHDFLQLIIYKAVTFSEEIMKVDTVRAYHVSRRPCIFSQPC